MHDFLSGFSARGELVARRQCPFAIAFTLTASFAISGCGGQQSTRTAWVATSMDYHEPYLILPMEPPGDIHGSDIASDRGCCERWYTVALAHLQSIRHESAAA